jgi:hypothetical protein
MGPIDRASLCALTKDRSMDNVQACKSNTEHIFLKFHALARTSNLGFMARGMKSLGMSDARIRKSSFRMSRSDVLKIFPQIRVFHSFRRTL